MPDRLTVQIYSCRQYLSEFASSFPMNPKDAPTRIYTNYLKTEQISLVLGSYYFRYFDVLQNYQTPLKTARISSLQNKVYIHIRSNVSCRSPSVAGHPAKGPLVLESDSWPSDATFTCLS